MKTENQSSFTKNSILIKAGIIAVLTLLMLIPVNMVQSLVTERATNKEIAKEDIISKWGGEQQLLGPILVIPFTEKINNKTQKKQIYLLPDEYNVNGDLNPEIRSRGIYDILCYQADMKISGKFKLPEDQINKIDSSNISWNEAFIIIGIPYLQGIKNKITFNINGKPQEVLSSVRQNDVINSGITINMPIDETKLNEALNFDFSLVLNGSEGLYLAPIGKQTSINLKSPHSSAKFTGDFLPNSRESEGAGFDVQWDIFDYNRNYAQTWIGHNEEVNNSKIGVELLLPIDQYQKNMRSAKYAILFIALTFAIFFIVELTSRKPTHPVQYLLVSFALVLFYCLLLAFSEQIGFNLSYAISASAIVFLITAYSHTIFKSIKQTLCMGLFLSALYIFLFTIIQAEEKSLLFGSIGLFVVLAIVMYASRKVQWYKEEVINSTNEENKISFNNINNEVIADSIAEDKTSNTDTNKSNTETLE